MNNLTARLDRWATLMQNTSNSEVDSITLTGDERGDLATLLTEAATFISLASLDVPDQPDPNDGP